MASPVLRHRGGLSMAPWEKEILGQAPPTIGIIRRDTASTTGSGMRMPLGHWTLPVSGNCPGCHHHHKSVEIHVKNINSSSELVDLHCEKCNKLWLGPGNKNSTRLSLVSHASLDPPPMDPEVRVTLAHMIRSTTRVATLSPLPGIQEGIRLASPDAASSLPIVQRMPNRVSKANTRDTKSTQPTHFILRFNRRLGRTFPILKSTRLGRRWMDLNEDHDTSTMRSASVKDVSQTQVTSTNITRRLNQDPCELLQKEIEVCTPPAIPTQGLNSRMIVDQNVIDDMRPEQRVALLRSQITAFSARHKAQSAALAKAHHDGGESHHSESFATLEAIRNSLLPGIGAFDTAQEWAGYSEGSSISNPLMSMSVTNMSEASTAVEGTAYAPQSYLNAILHRQPRQGHPARRSSAQSDVHAWHQSRQDQGEIRDSLESRGGSSTQGPHAATPTSPNTGTSTPQTRTLASHRDAVAQVEHSHDSAPQATLPQGAYREWG